MNWKVPKIWEGGDVWIFGGGASVTKQFSIPDSLVLDVLNGKQPMSAYSPYLKFLHGRHVIAINAAYKIGDWFDMIFFGDSKFFNKHKEELYAAHGLKVACTKSTQRCPWVKFLFRDKQRPRGLTENPKAVSWNKNSGAAAISMAVNAGAKRVFLLGFDMKLNERGDQHFHSEYKATRTSQNNDKRKNLPFHLHLRVFGEIARDAERRGVEIYNVCPDSAISELPRIDLQQAMELASVHVKPPEPPEIVPEIIPSPVAGKEVVPGNGVMRKYEILSLFHEILNPQLYLEIGVRSGDSLRLAKCMSIGIDPEPRIKQPIKNAEIHTMTSDEFFERNGLLGSNPDLVLIDGLHRFEQVIRDFYNAEQSVGRDTVILIDDVLPFEECQTVREKPANSEPWTGDVWKIIPILKKYRGDLEITMIDTGRTGLAAITNLNHTDTQLKDRYEEIVGEWTETPLPDWYLKSTKAARRFQLEEDTEWIIRNIRKVRDKRVLCAVVHYYDPQQKEGFEGGSTIPNPKREQMVHRVIQSAHSILNCDVKVCGKRGKSFPEISITKDFPGIDPHWLLYETLNWLVSQADSYDYLICVEDDILMGQDVLWNTVEFDKTGEGDETLLPNRFEKQDKGDYRFIDLMVIKGWTGVAKSWNGLTLREANNYNSSITVISSEKLKRQARVLNPQFREIWFGGPMASAHAYFHSPVTLLRDGACGRFNAVEHLDHLKRENIKSNHNHLFRQNLQNQGTRIDVKIPYGLNGGLAEAYNLAMKDAKTDWVLLLDHDVFLACNPYWYMILLSAIGKVDEKTGMITSVCNLPPSGIRKGTQNADLCIDSTDVGQHTEVSRQLWEKHGMTLREIRSFKVAGFFMLIRRAAWEQILFKSQGQGVDKIDWDFSGRLLKRGWKIYELPGLYVYHKMGVRNLDWSKKGELVL